MTHSQQNTSATAGQPGLPACSQPGPGAYIDAAASPSVVALMPGEGASVSPVTSLKSTRMAASNSPGLRAGGLFREVREWAEDLAAAVCFVGCLAMFSAFAWIVTPGVMP